MVVQTKLEASPAVEAKAQALEWMREAIEDGAVPTEAAQEAWAKAKAAGISGLVAETFAPAGLAAMWRHNNQQERRSAGGQTEKRVVALDGDEFMDTNMLMECLYKVGGRWRTLGEMDQRHTMEMEAFHRKQAEGHNKRATFFQLVRERLDDDKQVRQCMTEDDLQRLWAQAHEG